jgi:ABC-type lipoprotein release transport system permease subunit
MLIFAVLIVTLFIQLTVTSCQPEIVLLITLGCSPKQLSSLLLKRFFMPGLYLVAVGALITAILQYIGFYFLQRQQVQLNPYPSPFTIAVACSLIILIAAANQYSIVVSMTPYKKNSSDSSERITQ